MFRSALLALVLLCLASAIFAQTPTQTQTPTWGHFDVLVLKNGAVVRGHITERVEGKKIVLRLLDGRKYEVPYNKISVVMSSDDDWQTRQKAILDSIRQSSPAYEPARRYVDIQGGPHINHGKRGMCGSVGVGIFSPRNSSIGLSVGFERTTEGKNVPLMCELAFYTVRKRASPHIAFGVGYAIGWLDAYPSADFGGMRIQAGFGLTLKTSKDVATFLQMTLGGQQVARANVVTDTYTTFTHVTLGFLLF